MIDIIGTLIVVLTIGIFAFYRNHWTYKEIKKILNKERSILDKIDKILDKGKGILYDETKPHEDMMKENAESCKEYE